MINAAFRAKSNYISNTAYTQYTVLLQSSSLSFYAEIIFLIFLGQCRFGLFLGHSSFRTFLGQCACNAPIQHQNVGCNMWVNKACAWFKKTFFRHNTITVHNVTLTVTGKSLIWCGVTLGVNSRPRASIQRGEYCTSSLLSWS